MKPYIRFFQELDTSARRTAGGKGANLGELSRIEGIQVPEGFCVTTDAYTQLTAGHQELDRLFAELEQLEAADRESISRISMQIRTTIERIPMPGEVAEAIIDALNGFGPETAFAVRSSATAEDLPKASFAGQQDTYLNVIGTEAVLHHIRKCWASLYTERAVVYRIRAGFAHRDVRLAVVVQQMVFPQAAGVLFTADPVTANRKVLSIDAGFGLGEAIVSGRTQADHYRVRDGRIIHKHIPAKKLAVDALPGGGTQTRELRPEEQRRQVLTTEQILQLERAGRKIEAHFGSPQDIEWCLADGRLYIVQSRPITTLYPVPEAADGAQHVYISVGHNQMMTDAMKPLGLSFFRLTTNAPMYEAGGRLFVDITPQLASPVGRKKLLETLTQSDPLMKDALATLVRRKGFMSTLPGGKPQQSAYIDKVLPWRYLAPFAHNPDIVPDLIRSSEASIAALRQAIQTKSGTDLFDFILEDIPQLKKMLGPQSWEVIRIALYAASWINRKMRKWLGEKAAADVLSQSVPNNVTSEMGLALLEVADVIRPYPEVVACLQQVKDDYLPEELAQLPGGKAARAAMDAYLERYGMRCAGEIDITRTRWQEWPAMLLPILLGNIRNAAQGAAGQRFEQGLEAFRAKEQELLERLQQLPDGKRKAREAGRMIGLLRKFIGYREYPKYSMVSRYFVYRQALLKEAAALVEAGIIREQEDCYYLTFQELREVVRTHQLDDALIRRRKEAYRQYEQLTPPRVITADGEIIRGTYGRQRLPDHAIAGLAVSSGIVEGRARVILRLEEADLEAGDILVTAFTDPSWTPLFVAVKGLVTEAGGMMTHGAVIAREYGLPAVVGVEQATRLIRDGQHIRVNGTDGYVELL